MLTITSGNLLRDSADVLVNPVNTVGVMGKGLALQFKRAFPDNYNTYRNAHSERQLRAGKILAVPIQDGRWIVNFPTKRHWRQPSRLEDVSAGLDDLKRFLTEMPVNSVAVPPLGCGNGGLPWPEVRRLITEKLGSLDVSIRLYEPGTPTADQMVDSPQPPELQVEHGYLMAGIHRYIRQSWESGIAMAPRMSLIEAHKVAYFLQRSGLTLKLAFDKGHYGPYAPALDRFFAVAEGHYVRGYGDGTGGARADLWLLPKGMAAAESAELRDEFATAWQRVAAQVTGYEDPHGMELLASVDYLLEQLPSDQHTTEALRNQLAGWNDRKRQAFTAHHVAVALARLTEQPLVQTR